jgi:diguanylate cyclase (GGDEF)-like protein/PAS domain S-box-containing protein
MNTELNIGRALPAVLLRAVAFVSEGVLIARADRRLEFCNLAFTEITGFVGKDIFGKSCRFMQGAETDQKVVQAIGKALDDGRIFSAEILNYKKNGEKFWNFLTILPFFGLGGQLTHYIGIVCDITARKNAEAALSANLQRHQSLLDFVEAGIVIHNAAGDILQANQTAALLLGVPYEDLVGEFKKDPQWDFIREDGTPMPAEEYPYARAVKTGDFLRNAVVGVQRNGGRDVAWVMCNAHPVHDETGEIAEVVVSFIDITELKLAERAVQKSEERLRLVLQGSNDAPWDLDLVAGSAYYSPRWWQMVGREPNEVQPEPLLWTELLHPNDYARVMALFNQALNDGLTAYEIEYRLHHKSGEYVPVLSRAFILRDALGEPIRISGMNTDLTQTKIAEERIYQLAFYDPLTELPNRRLFREQLQKALLVSLRTRRQGALLFLDLDHFKLLNDTLGHEMGDMLLQQVAKRLRHAVGSSDTVARLGGDEYLIMLEDLPEDIRNAAIAAEKIGEKLLALLATPYILNGAKYCCTASIGIAMFGAGEQGVDGLFRQADLAMYQAKAKCRNTLRFFDVSMQTAVEERLVLENDLRQGVDQGEMVLHFQKQVVGSGDIVGAEVLLRWNHPRRGLILPGTFIPLAESSGMILPLGRWVLHEACRQLVAWAQDKLLSQLQLSVNISIRQFREPDFVAQVLAAIEETGADPTKLLLEVTESLFAEAMEDIVEKMNLLKARGVRFSLDDFGTGYSSLAYLQRMPLDELKIDRSFVHSVLTDENSSTIACIIIDLANKLQLNVIAEGVETEEQRAFLAANGCTIYQGYLFGRPLPIERFEADVYTAHSVDL